MNTKINLTHNDEKYVLEYDRYSIKLLERAGFKFDEFLDRPMTNIELAFAGAFYKNHPKVPQTTIDEIYDECPNKTDLIIALKNMIDECYQALIGDNEEKKSGNTSWETVSLTPAKEKKTQE